MATISLSRRDWLAGLCALIAVPAWDVRRSVGAAPSSQELVLNSRGGYRFLPMMPFLSFAARANDGFEIVRARFHELQPLSDGISNIERLLQAAGRPLQALCGLKLRSPRKFTGPEFRSFNDTYIERMNRAGLLVGNQVPMTRTNVAMPEVSEVSIHAFSYTMPIAGREPALPSFLLSAVPEVRNITTARPEFVAAGDTSPAGLREKTEFVLNAIDDILRRLGVGWTDVTGVQLYTVHDLQPRLADLILPHLGPARRVGIEWHHLHPPTFGNELEISVRGIRRESVALT